MNKCGMPDCDMHNYTHNFWLGCRKFTEGCKNCHMWIAQSGHGVDPSDIHGLKWQTAFGDALDLQVEAEQKREVYTVKACSYSDFFLEDADPWREKAWAIIKDTPNLVWQLLTKRTENIASRLPSDWGAGYPNVWLGATVELKKYLYRLDQLREIPCVLHWAKFAPMLDDFMPELASHIDGLSWVIISGECGCGVTTPHVFDYRWAREVRELCAERNVAFAFQRGSGQVWNRGNIDGVSYRALPPALAEYRAEMAKRTSMFDTVRAE